MNQRKITELILKLSLSTIPPSLQEYILSNLDKFSEEDVSGLITILDSISEFEENYLFAGEKYVEFYNKLSEKIKSTLIDEARKIQEELLAELAVKELKEVL
jgi:hypothetical protein